MGLSASLNAGQTVGTHVRRDTQMNKIRTLFEENGYYLAKGVFSPDEVGRLENEFDRIVQQLNEHDDSGTLNNNGVIDTRNVQQYSGLWMAALLHEKFLDIVEQFIGPDIVLNHTTLFEKRMTTAPTPLSAFPRPLHAQSLVLRVLQAASTGPELVLFDGSLQGHPVFISSEESSFVLYGFQSFWAQLSTAFVIVDGANKGFCCAILGQ